MAPDLAEKTVRELGLRCADYRLRDAAIAELERRCTPPAPPGGGEAEPTATAAMIAALKEKLESFAFKYCLGDKAVTELATFVAAELAARRPSGCTCFDEICHREYSDGLVYCRGCGAVVKHALAAEAPPA